MVSLRSFLVWDRFIAPKFLNVLYYLSLALIFISFITNLWFTITTRAGDFSFGIQLLVLIGVILVHAIFVMMVRLWFEFFMVVFRINENIEAIRKKGGM